MIRSVLRHRCIVRRATKTGGINTWADIAADVPCLLDANKAQVEHTSDTQEQDRSGILFALSNSAIRPGDRITLTCGGTGTFLVKPDPSHQNNLSGPSHSEFRVEEVPAP